MSEYAFCEPVTATVRSYEHIRVVSDGILYLGGGVPTPTLCGYDLRRGWDVPTGVTERRVRAGLNAEVNPTCPKCADIWGRSVLGDDWETP
jgi:hypothetical protein